MIIALMKIYDKYHTSRQEVVMMSKESRGNSLSDLLDFCGSLGTTNVVSNEQAGLFRTACNKVLRHLSPDEQKDVSTADIKAALEKYRAEISPSPSTLQSYGSRVRSAHRLFLESRMVALKEALPEPEPDPVEEKRDAGSLSRKVAGARAAINCIPQSATTASSMILRIPVRSDFVAQLVLPYDLSPVEAARLARLIEALPMGAPPARE